MYNKEVFKCYQLGYLHCPESKTSNLIKKEKQNSLLFSCKWLSKFLFVFMECSFWHVLKQTNKTHEEPITPRRFNKTKSMFSWCRTWISIYRSTDLLDLICRWGWLNQNKCENFGTNAGFMFQYSHMGDIWISAVDENTIHLERLNWWWLLKRGCREKMEVVMNANATQKQFSNDCRFEIKGIHNGDWQQMYTSQTKRRFIRMFCCGYSTLFRDHSAPYETHNGIKQQSAQCFRLEVYASNNGDTIMLFFTSKRSVMSPLQKT